MKQSKKSTGVGLIVIIPTQDTDLLNFKPGNYGSGDLVVRFCSGEILRHFNPTLEVVMRSLDSGEFFNFYEPGKVGDAPNKGIMMGYTPFPLDTPEAFGQVFKMAPVLQQGEEPVTRIVTLPQRDAPPLQVLDIDDSVVYFHVKLFLETKF